MENQIAEQLGTAVSQLIEEQYEADVRAMQKGDLTAWIVEGPLVVNKAAYMAQRARDGKQRD